MEIRTASPLLAHGTILKTLSITEQKMAPRTSVISPILRLERNLKSPSGRLGEFPGWGISCQRRFYEMRSVSLFHPTHDIASWALLQRHLYLTEEQTSFKVKDLLRVIYVPCYESFQGPQATVEGWVEDSYDQYYLRYCFPRLKVTSWADRRRVSWQELHVCTPCCKERLRRRSKMTKFLADMREKPLAVLDLFGGVGAFSQGLAEGSGSLTVAYAIEIGPSAAKSFL